MKCISEENRGKEKCLKNDDVHWRSGCSNAFNVVVDLWYALNASVWRKTLTLMIICKGRCICNFTRTHICTDRETRSLALTHLHLRTHSLSLSHTHTYIYALFILLCIHFSRHILFFFTYVCVRVRLCNMYVCVCVCLTKSEWVSVCVSTLARDK